MKHEKKPGRGKGYSTASTRKQKVTVASGGWLEAQRAGAQNRVSLIFLLFVPQKMQPHIMMRHQQKKIFQKNNAKIKNNAYNLFVIISRWAQEHQFQTL
jgi:hypothetical protein